MKVDHEQEILDFIRKNVFIYKKGAPTLKQISDALGLDYDEVYKIVKKLDTKKLVSMAQHPLEPGEIIPFIPTKNYETVKKEMPIEHEQAVLDFLKKNNNRAEIGEIIYYLGLTRGEVNKIGEQLSVKYEINVFKGRGRTNFLRIEKFKVSGSKMSIRVPIKSLKELDLQSYPNLSSLNYCPSPLIVNYRNFLT